MHQHTKKANAKAMDTNGVVIKVWDSRLQGRWFNLWLAAALGMQGSGSPSHAISLACGIKDPHLQIKKV